MLGSCSWAPLQAHPLPVPFVPAPAAVDWSYACVNYVASLSDPRNLATLALYAALLYIGLAAKPWDVLLEWAGRRGKVRWVRGSGRFGPPQQMRISLLSKFHPLGPTSASPQPLPGCPLQATPPERERRWRLAVAAGLLVGPFFPASNVLFYVGTFIGERLMYFPSGAAAARRWCECGAQELHCASELQRSAARRTAAASCGTSVGGLAPLPPLPPCSLSLPSPSAVGFCILLAQPLAWALQPLLLPPPANGGASAGAQRGGRRAQAAGVLLALLLCFYGVRTMVRNREWYNNETLFRAAEKVSRGFRVAVLPELSAW